MAHYYNSNSTVNHCMIVTAQLLYLAVFTLGNSNVLVWVQDTFW